jgi:hypothetical protein
VLCMSPAFFHSGADLLPCQSGKSRFSFDEVPSSMPGCLSESRIHAGFTDFGEGSCLTAHLCHSGGNFLAACKIGSSCMTVRFNHSTIHGYGPSTMDHGLKKRSTVDPFIIQRSPAKVNVFHFDEAFGSRSFFVGEDKVEVMDLGQWADNRFHSWCIFAWRIAFSRNRCRLPY